MKVNECMCKNVNCVKLEDTVTSVAKTMESNHIGCVPVCDQNNCICGIITDRDIVLRAIASDKDVNKTKASDIMTTKPYICTPDEEITNAQSKMSFNQIRRLPVCDEKNHVVGILTIGNLANNNTQIGKAQFSTMFGNICNCEGNAKNAE